MMAGKSKQSNRSVDTGNAGEHLVIAELLARGCYAFMADRGAPDFDISVLKNRRTIYLRVKTTRSGSLQWMAKKDGIVFRNKQRRNDFVVVVDLRGGVRGAVVYFVPTLKVERDLQHCHTHWHKNPNRNNKPHKMTNHRQVNLSGRPTKTNIGRGYEEHWKNYREAWHLIGARFGTS